jgi:hypothetical protein
MARLTMKKSKKQPIEEQKSIRVQAIEAELQKSKQAYLKVKKNWLKARTEFAIAQEQFGVVRRHASEGLSHIDWWRWHRDPNNAEVRFVGAEMGDAILEILRDRARRDAQDIIKNPDNENPSKFQMGLNAIVRELEKGSFEFRSATPAREVNAALIHLKGVTKSQGGYAAADAEQIMEQERKWVKTKLEFSLK